MKKIFLSLLIILTLVIPTEAAYCPYGAISVEKAKEMLSQIENPPEIIGIYDMIKGGYHGKFLVIHNTLDIRPGANYVALVIESPNKKEKSGSVKFFLTENGSDKLFHAEYFDYLDFSTANFMREALYNNGQISIYIYDIASIPPNNFIRTYSANDDNK